MKEGRDRPHPSSPVQRDRTNKYPAIVLALLAVFIVWKLRDTWVDALAPPVPQSPVAPSENPDGGLMRDLPEETSRDCSAATTIRWIRCGTRSKAKRPQG